MAERRRQLVTMGGGGFSMEPGNTLMDDYLLELTGKDTPHVCFLPTASGDADHYILKFYRAFSLGLCRPSHVSLFRRDRSQPPFERHLLQQDLIYVGGGSALSLIGTWRAHGMVPVLRQAYRRGTIICGLSAGALVWYAQALSSFHYRPKVFRGVGLLPYSGAVHYGSEQGRREEYQQAIADGLTPGYACSDGAALHFVDEQLHEAVLSRPQAQAFFVERDDDGVVCERPLAARYLGGEVLPGDDLSPEDELRLDHLYRRQQGGL